MRIRYWDLYEENEYTVEHLRRMPMSAPDVFWNADEQEWYEIQRIMDRPVDVKGRISYIIRWKGYEAEDDSWV